jgi:hypothetical protein
MGVGMGLLVGEVLGGHFAADVFLIALGVALFVYNVWGWRLLIRSLDRSQG